MSEVRILENGDVVIANETIGQLQGFRFSFSAQRDGKTAENQELFSSLLPFLAKNLQTRLEELCKAPEKDFSLSEENIILWRGESVARIYAGDTLLSPGCQLLTLDGLPATFWENAAQRVTDWFKAHVKTLLEPLYNLREEEKEIFSAQQRHLAALLLRNYGAISRKSVAKDIQQLDQPQRAKLRQCGVRFGARHIFIPALLKPGARLLLVHLWALAQKKPLSETVCRAVLSGRTSLPIEKDISTDHYRIAGFAVCGTHAVRIDILEKLCDEIRHILQRTPAPLKAAQDTQKPEPDKETSGDTLKQPLPGAGKKGFTISPSMSALLGCQSKELHVVLRSLGYIPERKTPSDKTEAEVSQDKQEELEGLEAQTGKEEGSKEEEDIWVAAPRAPFKPRAQKYPFSPQKRTIAPNAEEQTAQRQKKPSFLGGGGRIPPKKTSSFSKAPQDGDDKKAPPFKKTGKTGKAPVRRVRPVSPNSPFAILSTLKLDAPGRGPSGLGPSRGKNGK